MKHYWWELSKEKSMLKDRAGRNSAAADVADLAHTGAAEVHAGYVAQALGSYN